MAHLQIVQHFLSIVSFLLGIFFLSELLRDRKTPGSTWGWLLIMVLVPYLGVPLYLTLGRRKLRKKITPKGSLYRAVPYKKTPSELLPIERILLSSGCPKKTVNNTVKILPTGETAYEEMIHLIRNAKTSIWITTYILGNDSIGSQILSVLTEQAKKGIEVCLLLDGMGSFWVPRGKVRKLKQAGGKVAFFLPLIHIPFFGHSNLRNHRKLLIVDEKIAILGGMNLASEYLGSAADTHRWVDLSLLLEGSGVSDLALIFKSDWFFASQNHASGQVALKPSLPSNEIIGESSIQIVGSGPDVLGDPLYDSILSSIFAAQERIWIATPYFIPDDTLSKALELACRRGIDVRVIVPKKSNHFVADLCRGSYLRQLDRAGGRLFFDLHPMMHAKVTLIDKSYVVVGSANMDMRSLLLNYEVGAFLYSQNDIQIMSQWFLSLQNKAKEKHLKTTFRSELMDGLGRILSPIL